MPLAALKNITALLMQKSVTIDRIDARRDADASSEHYANLRTVGLHILYSCDSFFMFASRCLNLKEVHLYVKEQSVHMNDELHQMKVFLQAINPILTVRIYTGDNRPGFDVMGM